MNSLAISSGVRSIPFEGGLVLLDAATGTLSAYNDVAAWIWSRLAQGATIAQIALALVNEWGVPAQIAARDAEAIVNAWYARGLLGRPDAVAAVKADRGLAGTPAEPVASWTCAIRGRRVGFVVDAKLADPVRVLFRHLETDGTPDVTLTLTREAEGTFVLAAEGAALVRTPEAALAIGALHIAVLERVRPGIQWRALMHGAALARRDHGFALVGISGSGKSTLTAALIGAGYDYLADDLVALAAPDETVVPWPLPLSVKPGSLDILTPRFPALASAMSYPTKGVTARLLIPDTTAWAREPIPLRTLLFPTYRRGAAPTAQQLGPMDVLTALLGDRIWIGDPITAAQVEAFLAWIRRTPAYALTYGSLDDSLALVKELIP